MGGGSLGVTYHHRVEAVQPHDGERREGAVSPKAHLLVSIVTVFVLILIIRFVRRRELRAKYAFLWLSVGLTMVVLAISPTLLNKVSLWLGVFYPPTTLFLAAIILLLLIAVHVSWELSRLEERTRTLAEELAILRADAVDEDDPGGEPE